MATTAASQDIVITRTFAAPREKVWKAWTDPDMVKQWWGPEDFTSLACTIDLRVGGTYLFCMHGPAGSEFNKDMWSTGTYQEIIAMEKIVATDHFADAAGTIVSPKEYGMPGEGPAEGMLVTVTLQDAGPEKTTMTLVHAGHPKDIAAMATAGWNQSLDKLASCLGG